MNYNKILIYKKLKDIFSAKICPKYKHYSKDNNIKLIKEILNDKDENKNIKFYIFRLSKTFQK